jgi:hypothetical protein
MALSISQTVTTNLGTQVTLPAIYIRVENISGSKDHLQVNINYFTEQNGVVFKSNEVYFKPDLAGDNFIAQAYQFLKTTEEFKDAVDC